MCSKSHAHRGVGYLAWGTLLFIVGVAALVTALLLPGAVHRDLTAQLHEDFEISSPNTKAYPSWHDNRKDNSPVLHLDLYVYDITNPKEVIAGAVPNVKELGPFKFQLVEIMLNPVWHNDGDIVEFTYWSYYVPLETGPDYHTNVTNVRLGFAQLEALGQSGMLYEPFAATNFTNLDELLFVRKSVKEVLWGYHDDLLNTDIPGYMTNISTTADAMKKIGRSQIYTGKHTEYRAREYVTWNDQASLQCCLSGPCGAGDWTLPSSAWEKNASFANRIRGTDGTQFRAQVTKTDSLPVFIDQMFRTFDIVYTGTHKVKEIDVYRFQLNSDQLLNETANPVNRAYYADGPSGMQPITRCSTNVPLYLSKPHFLNCSDYIYDTINITRGIPSKHDSWLDVEPTTGTTLRVAERFQAALRVAKDHSPIAPLDPKKYPRKVWFPDMDVKYMPMFWLDKHAELTDHQAKEFRDSVYFAQDLSSDSKLAGYIAGPIFMVVGLILLAIGCRRYRSHLQKASPMHDLVSATAYDRLGDA